MNDVNEMIAINTSKKYNSIRKIGYIPNVAIGAATQDMWDFGEILDFLDYIPYINDDQPQGLDLFISSANNADNQFIKIYGLDGNGLYQTDVIQLQGFAKTVLNKQFFRIYHAEVLNSSFTAGKVYIYLDTTVVNGIPTDVTKVQAYIRNNIPDTRMSHFTIPWNMKGWLSSFYINLDEITDRNISFGIFTRKPGYNFFTGHYILRLFSFYNNPHVRHFDLGDLKKIHDFPLGPGEDFVFRTTSAVSDNSAAYEYILKLERL